MRTHEMLCTALAAVGVGAAVWVLHRPPGRPAHAPAVGAPSVTAALAPAVPLPPAVPPVEASSAPVPAAVVGAVEVAGRLAVAWWTYDWDDPHGPLRRSAPLLAPALAATLSAGASAPVLGAADLAAHRRVRVGAPSVTVADRSPDGVGLAITAPVTVTSAGGPEVSTTWAMEVLAVLRHGTWVIAGIDQ